MKLTLRPEWRLWPLSSFLNILDLKTGVTIALLFALLNKVAGVYGLIALLTGAGGSFAQLSMYLYSVIALVALTWGLRAVQQQDPKQTLYFAHLFFADHILSTMWTVVFATTWWLYTPHDGQHTAKSEAQKEIMKTADLSVYHGAISDAERASAALAIWDQEKRSAAFIIIFLWLSKFYFALLIYSYASHLRKGSYRSLPLTRAAAAAATPTSANFPSTSAIPEHDYDDPEEQLYPVHTPAYQTPHGRTPGGSVSSFTEFVSAPRGGKSHAKRGKSSLGNVVFSQSRKDEPAEVLFDEDERTLVGSHSKRGSGSGEEN